MTVGSQTFLTHTHIYIYSFSFPFAFSFLNLEKPGKQLKLIISENEKRGGESRRRKLSEEMMINIESFR